MSTQQILYVDMDDVLCDYSGRHQEMRRERPDVAYPQSIPGFFENLTPLPDAVSSTMKLMDRYDVYVLTAPSVPNPLCYSEKRLWIEAKFGYEFTKKLIISPNKGLLKGQFLIDDYTAGRGQEHFAGELLHFGSVRFPDWPAIMRYLT